MIAIPDILIGVGFVEVIHNDAVISTGTGFFVPTANGVALVTNRHIGVGRLPGSNELKDSRGRQPDRLRVTVTLDLGYQPDLPSNRVVVDIPIGTNDEPSWREHPTLTSTVDLVVFEVERQLPVVSTDPLDVFGGPAALTIADTVLVVGYPFGLNGGMEGLPVAVRGTLATVPGIPARGQPRFLIDARTREGMSGSPVFFYPHGGQVHSATGGVYANALPGVRQFMGIYSGRVDEQADIGYVIDAQVVLETIESGIVGGSLL